MGEPDHLGLRASSMKSLMKRSKNFPETGVVAATLVFLGEAYEAWLRLDHNTTNASCGKSEQLSTLPLGASCDPVSELPSKYSMASRAEDPSS